MKYFVIIIAAAGLTCNSIVRETYKVNKEVNFKSLEDYKSALEKTYQINASKVYYTSKADFYKFANVVIASKTDYLYGVFIDDSSKIVMSKYLLENQSCLGRVIKEIERAIEVKIKDELFKEISFQNISTGDKLQLVNNGKKKVVLIFGHTQGLLKRKDFVEVQEHIQKRQDTELYILSIDPVYYYEEKSSVKTSSR